jgi:hypothetical protein
MNKQNIIYAYNEKLFSLKNEGISQVQWCIPIVLSTWEAKAGG